ncbi:oligomeric, coiled-coil, peripheral membrane protein [Cryptotrichosporon argae]
MDILYASDGALAKTDKPLAEYASLEALYTDAAQLFGLDLANVLLFTDDSKQLTQEVLEEAWDKAGQSSSSAPQPPLFLYNRETFLAEPDQWAAEFQEDVHLPPPLDLGTATEVGHFQTPFIFAFDHLCHLQSLFKAQARALEVAYENLYQHLVPFLGEFATFRQRGQRALDGDDRLIRGYPFDMVMLRKVVIHDGLSEAVYKDREKDRDKRKDRDERRRTLLDGVNPRKMQEVKDQCDAIHVDYVRRFRDISGELESLSTDSDSRKAEAEQRIAEVEKEFEDGLARIDLAIQQIEALVTADSVDLGQDLLELDSAMREDLVGLTGLKNEFTYDTHHHIRHVAELQSRITGLVEPISSFESDLRSGKSPFTHLTRLQKLPLAYASTIIEVVRRQNFASFLLATTTRLSEILAKFTTAEQKRRSMFKIDVQSLLPYSVLVLDKTMEPEVRITVDAGAEGLAAMRIERRDVDNLLVWAEGLKNDPDVFDVLGDLSENPVAALQSSIEALIAKMEGAGAELSKGLERSLIETGSSRSTSPSASDQVKLLQEQRDQMQEQFSRMQEQYERRLVDIERSHQSHVRELEDRHEERVNFHQTRQGELQEELVRLRTDLEEEMIARQALSAELEDKAKEQDDWARQHEDQHDLVTALQADIAQEKDRATDLGTRLQEALLDVDGLRSSEQALAAQLQELQEERTRSLSTLGEAQLLARNLESELAGIKAELASATLQLVQAQQDRDAALRDQSAEAERLMRDHIAEADGDRAVLEHQSVMLTKELETLKAETREKLMSERNAAVRREDGLRAELSLAKAQLREVQRRETALVDELALAKDATTTSAVKETHQTELSRDAVALAGRYHEACYRLLTAINSSTTISGSMSIPPVRAKTPPTASTIASGELGDSVLLRSLATAQAFDLVTFTDSVLRTINLVKKWSKSCKQYREAARNKLTFMNFAKGDLALFLPTRNPRPSWAAFNVNAPHNFLRMTDELQLQLKGREYYIARIMRTEEHTASPDGPSRDVYGLADGLRYSMHFTEEWTPSQAPRPRRSTSTTLPHPDAGQTPAAIRPFESTLPTTASASASPTTRRHASGSYFAPVSQDSADGDSSPPRASPPLESPMTIMAARPMSTIPAAPAAPTLPSAATAPVATLATPISSPTIVPPSLPTGSVSIPAPPRPPFASAARGTPPTPPRLSPETRSASRTFSMPRTASRPVMMATSSPSARDAFAPSSLGRPPSVASSSLSAHLPVTLAKATPPMAVTTSAAGSSASASASVSASASSPAPSASLGSAATASHLAVRSSASAHSSPADGLSTKTSDSSMRLGAKRDPEVVGTGTGTATSPAATGSRFLSGLSLSRAKRSGSSSSPAPTPPTAMDMLKRFEAAGDK